jgi:hypothetical protein
MPDAPATLSDAEEGYMATEPSPLYGRFTAERELASDAMDCIACALEALGLESTMADIQVHDYGSLAIVLPLTSAASARLADNVDAESWQWMGGAPAVDRRYVDGLIDAVQDAGVGVAA